MLSPSQSRVHNAGLATTLDRVKEQEQYLSLTEKIQNAEDYLRQLQVEIALAEAKRDRTLQQVQDAQDDLESIDSVISTYEKSPQGNNTASGLIQNVDKKRTPDGHPYTAYDPATGRYWATPSQKAKIVGLAYSTVNSPGWIRELETMPNPFSPLKGARLFLADQSRPAKKYQGKKKRG